MAESRLQLLVTAKDAGATATMQSIGASMKDSIGNALSIDREGGMGELTHGIRELHHFMRGLVAVKMAADGAQAAVAGVGAAAAALRGDTEEATRAFDEFDKKMGEIPFIGEAWKTGEEIGKALFGDGGQAAMKEFEKFGDLLEKEQAGMQKLAHELANLHEKAADRVEEAARKLAEAQAKTPEERQEIRAKNEWDREKQHSDAAWKSLEEQTNKDFEAQVKKHQDVLKEALDKLVAAQKAEQADRMSLEPTFAREAAEAAYDAEKAKGAELQKQQAATLANYAAQKAKEQGDLKATADAKIAEDKRSEDEKHRVAFEHLNERMAAEMEADARKEEREREHAAKVAERLERDVDATLDFLYKPEHKGRREAALGTGPLSLTSSRFLTGGGNDPHLKLAQDQLAAQQQANQHLAEIAKQNAQAGPRLQVAGLN